MKDLKPEELNPYQILVKAIDYTLTRKGNVAFNDKGNVLYDLFDSMGLFANLKKPERVAYLEKAKRLMSAKLNLPVTSASERRELHEKLKQSPPHPDVVDFVKRLIVAGYIKKISEGGPEYISKFLTELRSKINGK